MGERKKWFDAVGKHEAPRLPVPTPVVNTAAFMEEDYIAFRDWLAERSDLGLLPIFHPLIVMAPAERLKRNLAVTLKIICAKTIQTMLRDGVTEKERDALITLERARAPEFIRWAAYQLLNIEERYQFSLAWEPAFKGLRR
jgi:hypothetical protein